MIIPTHGDNFVLVYDGENWCGSADDEVGFVIAGVMVGLMTQNEMLPEIHEETRLNDE